MSDPFRDDPRSLLSEPVVPLPDTIRRRVIRHVASKAHDVADLTLLLDMLALDPAEGR